MDQLIQEMEGGWMPDYPEQVCVGEKKFDVQEIFSIADIRNAFRKTLEAQEYRVGNRSLRRPELKVLYDILKDADSQAQRKCWDSHSGRSSRQILFTD